MLTTFRSPRQIIAGEGTLPAAARLAALRGTRALLLSDDVISRQPSFQDLRADMEAQELLVREFTDAMADVPLEVIDRCCELARAWEPDVIVALGGGTVLDLAKMTALLVVHGGSPRDYYGENRVPGPVTPVIAVPTTAGTGSEVTSVAVVSDPERELKVGISSRFLIPEVAVCDPATTRSCPSTVTAYAGIDAFCHAVEAFTARLQDVTWSDFVDRIFVGKNAISDELALRAVELLAEHLELAVKDGDNREARAAVMEGSTLGGLAFAHAGTAAPHALQYPLGEATKTPHGLGVGMLLPYVLTAAQTTMDENLRALARPVGLEEHSDDFISWVEDLNGRIGLPASLREIGLARADLPELAEKATTVRRLLQNHPGSVDADALHSILKAAWEGDRRLLR